MKYVVDNFWAEPQVANKVFDTLDEACEFIKDFDTDEGRWTLYAVADEDAAAAWGE